MSIEATIDLDIRPKQLAEIFWSMNSDQQAEFYSELYKCIQRYKAKPEAYMSGDEFADMQWYHLPDGVKQLPEEDRLNAANMIRAVAAPFFLYPVGYDSQRFSFEENWSW